MTGCALEEVLRGGSLPGGSAVLAAHPDDEVIGAAVLLARSPGCRVIHLTDGAPRDARLWPRGFSGRSEYALLRRAEAGAALALVGIEPDRIHRVGAVDQEACRELARLARAVAALVARLRPPVLVIHAYEGGHPDHDAASFAGRAAADLLARGGLHALHLVEMTSYHASEGGFSAGSFLPDPQPQLEIVPSRAELELKRRMLALHESQSATLAAFPPGAERFRLAPPADFSRPPHPGKAHFEQMGWMGGEELRSLAAAALEELALPSVLAQPGPPLPPPAAAGRR